MQKDMAVHNRDQYAYLDIYSNYAEQETNIKWNPAENKRPCRNGLLLHGYFCN